MIYKISIEGYESLFVFYFRCKCYLWHIRYQFILNKYD